jgi:hypothetical protein
MSNNYGKKYLGKIIFLEQRLRQFLTTWFAPRVEICP